ncbi:MAG TPA: hypothetical protein PKD59_06630 [Miltoncostaeaceae bacterium]|nr:hypothetical protein [Miltoncostaeaceae bacterium]
MSPSAALDHQPPSAAVADRPVVPPGAAPLTGLLGLQQSIGNAAVARMMSERPRAPGGAAAAHAPLTLRGSGTPTLAREGDPGGGAPAPAAPPAPATPTAPAAAPAAPSGPDPADTATPTLPFEGDFQFDLNSQEHVFPIELPDLRELEIGVGKLSTGPIPLGESGINAELEVGSRSPLTLKESSLILTPVGVNIAASVIKEKRETKEAVTSGLGTEGAVIGGIAGGFVGGLVGHPLAGAEKGGAIGGGLGESLAHVFVGEQTLKATLTSGGVKARFVLGYAPFLKLLLGVPIVDELINLEAKLQTELDLIMAPFFTLAGSSIELHFTDGKLSRSAFTLKAEAGIDAGLRAFGQLSAGVTILRVLSGDEPKENLGDEGLATFDLLSTGVFPIIDPPFMGRLSAAAEFGFTKESPLEMKSKRIDGKDEEISKILTDGMKGHLGDAIGSKKKPAPPEGDDRLHTGTVDDPVPMIWVKDPKLYPRTITRDINGKSQRIHAFPHEHYPPDDFEAGVDGEWWPHEGKILKKTGQQDRGDGAPEFRDHLETHGVRMDGSWQMDHVQDIQFGGVDSFSNLWVFEGPANMTAGTLHAQQTVPWRDPAAPGQRLGVRVSATPPGTVFVIKAVRPGLD